MIIRINAAVVIKFLDAAFIRGGYLMIFLLDRAAFNRGRRLFEGGVHSNNYGTCTEIIHHPNSV